VVWLHRVASRLSGCLSGKQSRQSHLFSKTSCKLFISCGGVWRITGIAHSGGLDQKPSDIVFNELDRQNVSFQYLLGSLCASRLYLLQTLDLENEQVLLSSEEESGDCGGDLDDGGLFKFVVCNLNVGC
jgi:hypothetical protein